MATRIYKTPFAATGDKESLATADQPDGKVSLQAGWTPDYELPNDNANYRPVGRSEMNGILNEVTEGLGEIQLNGFAKWQAVDGGWPSGAWVSHNTAVYRSTMDANTTEPGAVGAAWLVLPAGIASTVQAQALTDDSLALTPKKLADAFKGGNQSLSANGFQKYPGGLIEQWCTVSGALGGTAVVTFPIAFPNAVLHAMSFYVAGSDPGTTAPPTVGGTLYSPLTVTGTNVRFGPGFATCRVRAWGY